ncbi:MAG: putative b-lactamase [Parcubacteria bacterium C7867-008]|nr:MAG: putative b-lactamase [Parcubacteria bacterium C7867-008]
MKITKFPHSCLLIETKARRILIDPGSWNTALPELTDLNAILITHEHQDHFDLGVMKPILAKNPGVQIITHSAVGQKLDEAEIAYTLIEPGQTIDISGVSIESCGTEHAIIYGSTSPCRNTGYLIDEKLFVPGDAVHDMPAKQVEILALPTGGPWYKTSESIDYAKAVKPNVVFPIHDAMYTNEYKKSSVPRWFVAQLEPAGIRFENLQDGMSQEF